ncbi:MAG: MBL fold metallo-hydrolase [Candidatus Aenigmarchaeota archaeon]|nr:MBL fold metallo-hydrolase [Candidatus Aenigmarchaeota archaeon]
MQLNFLGAMNRVTPSGILVDTGKTRFVLDYGADVEHMPPKPPMAVDKVDYILLSHGHLDHCGSLPMLVKKNGCPIISNACTKELTELLLLDSVKINMMEAGDIEEAKLPFDKQDVKVTVKKFVDFKYRKPLSFKNTEIIYYDAGHIPGSAMILMKIDGKTLLYDGNFNTIDTRLLAGCDQDLPKIDYLITESTYAQREHPDRKSQEKELVQLVNETISNDGVALISTFAIGRAQEILLILDSYGIDYPLYIDGMARKSTTIINKYKNLLKEPRSLDDALKKVTYVNGDGMRSKIIKRPCAIITTSGMLSGGTVVPYIQKLHADKNSSLILTGFQVPGTPGHTLLQTGRFVHENSDLEVEMFVKRFDMSAHAGRKEIFSFIKNINPEKVFCVHGDDTKGFAEELKGKGFDAVAPTVDNKIFNI